jgi:hypothetical protein
MRESRLAGIESSLNQESVAYGVERCPSSCKATGYQGTAKDLLKEVRSLRKLLQESYEHMTPRGFREMSKRVKRKGLWTGPGFSG